MSGRTLGHYRILGPLGAGGMGVVYEAEDVRLGRRVAVKFLHAEAVRTPAAKTRFLREARAAAALSHPNICAVHDVGEDGGQPFLVMERLEGTTLERIIAGRPRPIDEVLELGAQIADALEMAHSRGVLHLDVKPSNIFVTSRGDAKLMDFGVAAMAGADAPRGDDTATGGPGSEHGVVAGTAAYMSPEQARGESVDRRSDLFSLGSVLYEMAAGHAAFRGGSSAEILVELLGRDPSLDVLGNNTHPLRAILEKALCKDPRLRYQTAADLAVDLRRAQRRELGDRTASRTTGTRGWMPSARLAAAATALLLVAGAAWWVLSTAQQDGAGPRFTQLTFRRGVITGARFSNDGQTVVYSALWDGQPPQIFSRRLESSESTPLALPASTLLSLSTRGDLAILLAPTGERGTNWLGTLARVPLSGGPAREVLQDVFDADWSPDGQELAVVRWRDGQFQLEYPVGNVVLRPAPAARLRVSPSGDRIALVAETGIVLIDRAGHGVTLAVPPARQRLAWSPDGRSLVVDAGDTDLNRMLHRVDLDGRSRVVYGVAGSLMVHDVARDGRMLIHHGIEHWGVRVRAPGEPEERDASVYANANVSGLSSDGSRVLLWDGSQGPPGAALLGPTAGGPVVRLQYGRAHGLSDDASWVALETDTHGSRRFVIAPTGPGEVTPLDLGRLERPLSVWMVARDRVGLNGFEPGRPPQAFLARSAPPRLDAITPEGTVALPGLLPGGRVLARERDGALAVYSLEGEREATLQWRLASDPFLETVRVSGDGRSLYVRRGSVPARVDIVDLETGASTPWNALAPEDATGTAHVWSIFITPDGRGHAYTHGRFLQDLFLVDGLP